MSSLQIMRMSVALLSGIMFGAGMVISGMTDPKNVIAFLDVTGQWDPRLAFVMGGALLVFAPCYHFFIKQRKTAINGDDLAIPSNKKLDKKLIGGAAIFGVGWGLAGICPGPAIASVSGGSVIIFGFIFCMLLGMIVARVFLKTLSIVYPRIYDAS